MNSLDGRTIVGAWIEIWHELPELLGSAWRDVFPRVMEILEALRVGPGEEERELLVDRLVDEIQPHANALKHLSEVIDRHPQERTDAVSGPAIPPWSKYEEGIASCIEPPVVVRRVEIRAPRRLSVGAAAEVSVALPAAELSAESPAETIRLQARLKITVILHGTPGLLEVLSEDQQEALIEDPAKDPSPMHFTVRGVAAGHGLLVVDIRQNNLFLNSFNAPLEVVEEETDTREASVHTRNRLDTGGSYGLPADLDLQILVWPQDRWEFDLRSWLPGGPSFHEVFTKPAQAISGEAYQRRLIEKMDEIRAEPVGLSNLQKLETEGRRLFQTLFPPVLQTCFRALNPSLKTLQIISNEPWIPWELVRCSREGETKEEFLCERFSCARWISGTDVPVAEIRVGDLACVAAKEAPGRKPLRYPEDDRACLQDLASILALRDRSPEPATDEAFLRLHASREIDLWHIAAPELPFRDDPGEMAVVLQNGRRITANDLVPGPRESTIRRPLVFMNVSQGARLGWWLGTFAGWAQAWVTDGRCGAFVAPLWNVSDSLAHLFASTFYQALREKAPLGEAMAMARLRVRAEAPGDPTWIAYQLYAWPNTRVRWEPSSPGAE